MRKTLKDLALALLNATLILVALCLVLGLTIVNRANGLTETFAQNLISVDPLRADIQSMTGEVTALRADVAALTSQTGDISSATLQRIDSRIGGIEQKMEDARSRVNSLSEAPTRLIDHSIEKAADEFATSVSAIRGCAPAAAPET